MGKKNRRNEKSFIIIEIIILILIFTSILIYYHYKNIKDANDKKFETLVQNYNKKESKIKNIEKEIEETKNNISNYTDINTKISNAKDEYFKTIKKLEDNILSGKTNKKIAYLTFDDGPYFNTYKVLDILDKYNVKATFFTTTANGEYCFDNKSQNCFVLYNEYLKRGHTIANHTYTHGIWYGLYSSTDSFINAVKQQEEHIKNQTNGYTTNILRFPGGSPSAGSLKQDIMNNLRNMGYGWVDWSAGDGDGGKLISNEQAWSNFTSSINENIEVVLLHDYNKITTDILPNIIEYLQNNGYILLPLFYESNMIKK